METQSLHLNKEDKLLIGVSWKNKSPLEEADVDLIALMLDKDKKVLEEKDVIFYNNLTSSKGALFHTGDNMTGNSLLDDEVILVDLAKVRGTVRYIRFFILNERKNDNMKDLHFRVAMLENKFDIEGKTLCEYEFKDLGFTMCHICEIQKQEDGYKMEIRPEKTNKSLKDVFLEYEIDVQKVE